MSRVAHGLFLGAAQESMNVAQEKETLRMAWHDKRPTRSTRSTVPWAGILIVLLPSQQINRPLPDTRGGHHGSWPRQRDGHEIEIS